jgi:hypothetical protein
LHSVGEPDDPKWPPKWPPKWVGMIALMGLDAETGVFMLLFCSSTFRTTKPAVKCVRPKAMTVCAAFIGLLRFRTKRMRRCRRVRCLD